MKIQINRCFPVLLLFVFFFPSDVLFGQEQVIPIGSNAQIKTYLHNPESQNLRRSSLPGDTVTLPFVDDFSKPGIYPDNALWADSDAFINETFCVAPPTIGVATLDGIDQYGIPYDSTAGVDGLADHLTSRPIYLQPFLGDTTVWLSFFYQPRGLGDEPDAPDSLGLEFKDSLNAWHHIWSVPGRGDTAFKRMNFHINDSDYLYNGFQFRFYNIATINGNRDHWNIDYVILQNNTKENDSIPDNALINPQHSLLSEFSAMPYTHYKNLSSQASAMVTSINDTVHDINYGQTSYAPEISVEDQTGSVIFSNGIGSINSYFSNNFVPFTIPVSPFVFPSNPGDSADFTVKVILGPTGSQTNVNNDTSTYHQHFYNYYAYDDGSAEFAYGVSGNTDVKIACRYNVKMKDTLRGIQIYFNWVGPNVHTKLFQLAVWDQINVNGNSDNLLYKMINQKPANVDSINGFATYLFDDSTNALVLNPGNYYFGFIQNDPTTLYGVGLDRNTDAHSNVFYHLDGFWRNTQVIGALMIRPLFGDSIRRHTISVQEISNVIPGFQLYPNPANESFRMDFKNTDAHSYRYEVLNILGSVLLRGEAIPGEQILIDQLKAGMYFVRLSDVKNRLSSTQKLLIN